MKKKNYSSDAFNSIIQIICKISMALKTRNKMEKSHENTAKISLVFAIVAFPTPYHAVQFCPFNRLFSRKKIANKLFLLTCGCP